MFQPDAHHSETACNSLNQSIYRLTTDTNLNTHHCPACNSPNLWADDHEGTNYKHCYECTFVWDSQLEEQPTKLKTEAREHAMRQAMRQNLGL